MTQQQSAHAEQGATRDPVAARRFRRTLVSVMAVQVVTLLLLGLLQHWFTA